MRSMEHGAACLEGIIDNAKKCCVFEGEGIDLQSRYNRTKVNKSLIPGPSVAWGIDWGGGAGGGDGL